MPTFLKPALENKKKYTIIPAGRRTGKTFNTAQWLNRECLITPNTPALWVDTTQSNIDKYIERYFKVILSPIWHMMNWNGQKKVLTFPNKSYIDFGSAERPENLEGFGYKRSVLNEAGIILRKQSLWDNTLQPMFKGKDVEVKVIGTSKGKNKFHQLFMRGNIDPDYASFRYTAYDSPFWDHAELDKLKQTIPAEIWRQEYMAEFLEGAGSVFRKISQCIDDIQLQKGLEGKSYVMGVDLAKHQDFTVIMVADRETKQVVHMDRFNKIDWVFQKQRIIGTWERFNRAAVIIDATGVGDPIYDDLKMANINITPFKFTSGSKQQLIQNLSVSMDNGQIRFPPYPVLIDELELFEYNVSMSGNIRYSAPEGFHDDTVIALALVNHGMKGTSTSIIDYYKDAAQKTDTNPKSFFQLIQSGGGQPL